MAKRRGRNEGTLYELPSGKVRAQVSVDGKRLSKTCDTKKEAKEWIRATQNEIDRGLNYRSAVTSFGEFLQTWLASREDDLAISTFNQYTHYSQKFIIPYIGAVKFKDLKPAFMQGYINGLAKDGVGARTVQICNTIVRSCLNHAVVMGLLPSNPANKLLLPVSKNKQTIQVWTDTEISAFVIAIQGARLEHLYCLAITTGMRSGELRGLKWSDVDWLGKTIFVQRAVYMTPGGGYIFKDVKTKKGRRIVELSDVDMEHLRAQLEKVDSQRRVVGDRWTEEDLIFPSTVGTPMTRWELLKNFARLQVITGVAKIRFHDLRHTSASYLLASGEPDSTVQGRLGHSSIHVTLDLYGHLIPGAQRRGANFMGGLISPMKVSKDEE